MGVLAFLRVGVWLNGLRAFQKGFKGNVFGEGFVLGGVFVIGRGQQVIGINPTIICPLALQRGKLIVLFPQGILLEHRECEFGDRVNIEEVIRAARRIPQELLTLERRKY